MRFQELRSWNRKKSQERKKGSAVQRRVQWTELGLPLRCLVPWTALIHCGRCHGLLYRIQLRDWGGSRGQDGCDALQCITCGDIIDPVIVKNRRGFKPAPMVRRKTRDGRRQVALLL